MREKLVFIISLAFISFFLFAGAIKTGVPADEPIDYFYGKSSLSYFASRGKDTSYLAVKYHRFSFPDQKYYGAAFEMIAPVINSVIKPENIFIAHHLLVAFSGILLILFTGLTARRLKGKVAGITAIWLMFLTPVVTGNAFFNSKDIPLAAAFAAGCYFLFVFFDTLPLGSRKALIGIAISIIAAVSIRISGLLLPFYLGLFVIGWLVSGYFRKNSTSQKLSGKALLQLGGAVGVGVIMGLITYPNLWHQGLEHITGALAVTRKFPYAISMLYKDKVISSLDCDTTSYLNHYILNTIPELILIGFILAIMIFLIFRNRFKPGFNWFLVFAAVFPFAYAMITKLPVYNGWRHLLFAYPFVIVATSIGLGEGIRLLKTKSLKIVASAVLVAGMIDLFVWQVRAFPYNYIYYNHLSGGLGKVYGHFDIDYQQLATYEGMNWLVENNEHKGITVMSNNANALKMVFDTSLMRFEFLSIRDMWTERWDYAVVSTIFLNQKAIEAMFPPQGTIHTVKRFGIPLAFVVKRQSEEFVKVAELVNMDSSHAAQLIVEKELHANQANTKAWYWKAVGLFESHQYQQSLQWLQRYGELFPEDVAAAELRGYNNYYLGNWKEALKWLGAVYKYNPNDYYYNQMIGDCYMKLGYPDEANKYYSRMK